MTSNLLLLFIIIYNLKISFTTDYEDLISPETIYSLIALNATIARYYHILQLFPHKILYYVLDIYPPVNAEHR